jgi:hypothetical protein
MVETKPASQAMRIEAIISYARFIFDTAIRGMLFALPVTFVAKWCGVPPTWESPAFMAFCIFWSSVVLDERSASGERHNPPVPWQPKRAVVLLTPAEVAAEARKLVRGG